MTRRFNVRAVLTPLLASLALALGACGATTNEDGSVSLPDVSLPDVSLPDVEAPDITAPDLGGGGDGGGDSGGGAPAPADGGAASGGSSDDGLDVWAVIAMLAIVMIGMAWIYSVASRNRQDRQSDVDRHQDQRRRLDSILSSAQWADSQALQVANSTDPASLAAAQGPLQSHFMDAENDTARLSGEVDDQDLAGALSVLGQSLATLRGTVVSYLGAATNPQSTDAQLTSLKQTLDSRRSDVEVASQRVAQYTGRLN